MQKRKADTQPSEEGREKTGEDAPKELTEDMEVKVQSSSAEPEEEAATQTKRKRAAHVYGAWEQVKEEKDP